MRGGDRSPYVVIICTRDRPAQLGETLDALARQAASGFRTVVVDQSDAVSEMLRRREAEDPALTVIHDHGRGLSRGRNVAWRATSEPWLVFVDDDCVPEPDFTAALERALDGHPEVDMISGHVGARVGGSQRSDDLSFSSFEVLEEQTLSGRWTHPSRIGFGVCFAVRRTTVDRLGGWDERLGPGVPDFPAADDMDFNFRLLSSGGAAYLTPLIRSQHDQWRSRPEVVALYAGYTAAWAGLAVKVLRSGRPAAAVWLWWGGGPRFAGRMLLSGIRRRSRFRVRVALRSAHALVDGTRRALRRCW
jgi:GT2 family glycosyltransferase